MLPQLPFPATGRLALVGMLLLVSSPLTSANADQNAAPALVEITPTAFDYDLNYPATGQTNGPLLLPANGANAAVPRSDEQRTRAIAFNVDALQSLDPAGGDRLSAQLFDDVAYELIFERIEWRGEDDYTWFGRLADVPGAHFILVRYHEAVRGIFDVFERGQVLRLRCPQLPAGTIAELSKPTPECAIDGSGEEGGGIAGDICTSIGPCQVPPVPVQAPLADSGNRIHVLMTWTIEAGYDEGGGAAMVALAYAAIADGNTRLHNSQCATTLWLAGAFEFGNYTESNNSATELTRVTCTSDGLLDGVHGLREQHHADLVVLINNGFADGTAGRAGLLQNETWACNQARGFAVVTNESVDNGTVAHELGHCLGCCHDHGNCDSDPLIAPYAHGRCFPSGAIWYYTTVSYDCSPTALGTRIPFYSNPNITYGGVPIGVAGGSENYRVINETRDYVANYRHSDSLVYVRAFFLNPQGAGTRYAPFTDSDLLRPIAECPPGGILRVLPSTYYDVENLIITAPMRIEAPDGPVVLKSFAP